MNLAISGSLYSGSACFAVGVGLSCSFALGPFEGDGDDDHIQPILSVWCVEVAGIWVLNRLYSNSVRRRSL